MPSVLFVAGARPNFMKVAPIMRELAKRGGPLRGELVHTGQHYDYEMSGVFFEQLGLPKPDVFLNIGSGSHGVQTGRIMVAFEEHLASRPEAPHSVVVVGDVNSTMACALVAVKRRIPVVHVEAGLRSFDRDMPEEINRLVTDSVADLLLVSEPAGIENLRREGIPDKRVRYVGNVMIDTLVQQLLEAKALEMPATLGLAPGTYAVVTLHRPSNVDEDGRLRALVELITDVSNRVPVVFPVHPRTEKRIRDLGLFNALTKVRVSPPLGYREFVGLMASARIAITDSGGIQEETSFLGIPCVTLRLNTERPVTIIQGTNKLAGDDLVLALRLVDQILAAPKPASAVIDGWDGHAVVDAITASSAAD
jgi:UDP-N-acetylglucosamine 2-epimerase (non-hydrolysing)